MTGRFLTLDGLVRSAYDLQPDQLSGGPAWVYAEHYDVSARGPTGPEYTQADFRFMLQALLADRFGLVVHRETRDVPVYLLEPAKAGIKLKQSAPDASTTVDIKRGLLSFSRVSVGVLSYQLADILGRPVVDRTGLGDTLYDITVRWAPENQAAIQDDAARLGPSLFTALQEQLGLKLESQKAPQEFLIIDQARPPSEN